MPRYFRIMLTRCRVVFLWYWVVLCLACSWGAAPPERAWTSIGPFGGGSQVVVIDPTNPNRLYTITSNSFLYRSEDEGLTWRVIRFPAQQAASAHALVINPSNSQEIWIAVSSGNASKQGIYRTSNGGTSWRHLEGLKGESVFSLALFANDSQVIAAGARDGVHLSRDQGATWNRISPLENKELQPIMSLAFDPTNDKTIYAGTPHLPWKTTDGGATWRSIHRGMIDDSDILSLIVNPKHPSQLFIGACSGIYRSDNSAALWTKLLGITGAGYRTYSVVQDPSNANIIFSGTRDGLWKSADGGKTWHKTSPHIVKSIAISPVDSKKVYLATEDAGMLRSVDGGETIAAGLDGFADHRLNSVTTGSRSIYVTGAQDREVWRIASDAVHKGHRAWSKMRFPVALQGQRIAVSTLGSSVYALGSGAMFRSMDDGVNWTRLTALAAPATGLVVLSALEVIAATSRSLYRSVDAGLTWKPLVPLGVKETALRVFSTLGTRNFILETSLGFRYYQEGAATSTAMPMPVRTSEVNDIVFAGNALVAATSRGVCRSTDKGATWQFVTKGIDAGTVASIASCNTGACGPGSATAVFAAQYGKVYLSHDTGASWLEITIDGLDETSILRLAVAPAGRLIALTPSRGLFVLEESGLTEAVAKTNGSHL